MCEKRPEKIPTNCRNSATTTPRQSSRMPSVPEERALRRRRFGPKTCVAITKMGGIPSKASSSVSTINATRKATVAYPTVKRLLFHMFYATHLQKLLKSHEMV